MTIVVGFGPDTRSSSGVRLAAQLATSTGSELVLCCVVYDAFASPTMRDFSDVDADWRAALESMADAALREARSALPEGLSATEVVRPGRSVPAALQEEGARVGARILVVGSSSQGTFGRIGLGSTSDRLVHSSEVPVALAPRGYQPARVDRVVFAVAPSPTDVALAGAVGELAGRLEAGVEVVTFGAGGSSPAVAAFADQGVRQHWQDAAARTQGEIAATIGGDVARAGVIMGERWSQAVASYRWREGDLLVVGSSEHGALSRVFLGSTATRILRHSPVPTLLMPRV